MKEPLSRKLFVLFNTCFLIALCILMFAPLLRVIAVSLSTRQYVENYEVMFWPKGFMLDSYWLVFTDNGILRTFINSVIVTGSATLLSLAMTAMLAYPLSRPEFKYKKQVLLMVTITMIVSVPLIPQYLLVKFLGMDNTLLAVIIPGAISGFYFHIMRSFFLGLPTELIDAARIDGCSETGILMKVVLPLSKAVFAAVGLMYGVINWNALGNALIYLRNPKLYTLQIKLYNLLQMDTTNNFTEFVDNVFAPVTIQMTTAVVATIPILAVYPFLQKYFAQGATLGSVKE